MYLRYFSGRGYTGHEHLTAFGLINMNARLYDPLTAQFFSPDPYIQAPYNWLNYNRYSYCLNNPFKYTDPSGNNPLLAAIFIGAWINVTINGIQGNINSAGDFWLSMGVGGLSGLAGYGAGQAVSSIVTIGGFANGAIVGAAGGAAGGFVSNSGNAWMNGASIGDGLISGFKGTGIGALTGSIMGGLAKGIDAAANQASFWDGHEDLDLSNGIGAHNIKDNLNAARGYYKGKFEGIRIFESKELGTYAESANGWSGGITLPGRGITVGQGVFSKGYDEQLLRHEFGHILQAREIGIDLFYSDIAPASLYSASHNSASWQHKYYWTEVWANNWQINIFIIKQ